MTNIIELTDNVIGVVVPNDSVSASTIYPHAVLFKGESGALTSISLPYSWHDGNWSKVALSTNITEEQAKLITPSLISSIYNIESEYFSLIEISALESFQSLLKSKGINEPVLILKREG